MIEIAEVSHVCEGEIIAMCTQASVPLLARMVYTNDKKLVGKVDDVFGPMSAPGVQVIPDKNSGVQASAFKKGDKVSFEIHSKKRECHSNDRALLIKSHKLVDLH